MVSTVWPAVWRPSLHSQAVEARALCWDELSEGFCQSLMAAEAFRTDHGLLPAQYPLKELGLSTASQPASTTLMTLATPEDLLCYLTAKLYLSGSTSPMILILCKVSV